MTKLFALVACLLAFSPSVFADVAKLQADTSSPELNRIKALEGRWVSTTSMFGKKNEKVYTEYKVVSSGSAVVESVFPGTPHEMVSVYYDDNGKLAMTHYCMLRNRPSFKVAKSDADSITLKVKEVAGRKSKKDPAMGDIKIEFKGKNRMIQTCTAASKKDEAMSMEYTRVR